MNITKEALEALINGFFAYQNNDWDRAIPFLKEAIKKNGGKYPGASYCLGAIYKKRGEHIEAIQQYEKAIKDNGGKYPKASYYLGAIYKKKGEHIEAIQQYEKAIQDNGGKYPEASFGLGVIYEERCEYTEAIKHYKKAVEDNGGKYPNVSNNLGVAYNNKGEYEKAIEHYKKAIEDNGGKYPNASSNLGVAYKKKGEYTGAIKHWKKAIKDNGGKYPVASYNLGVLYEKKGKYTGAIKHYKKAIKDNGGKLPEASCNLGVIYDKKSKYTEAIEHWKKAIKDNGGKFPGVSCNLGILYYKVVGWKNTDKAIAHLTKAITDSKKGVYSEAHLYLSKAYRKKGDYEKARNHAFIALKQDVDNLGTVQYIIDYFTNTETLDIYRNKQAYLELIYLFTTDKNENVLSIDEKNILYNIHQKKELKQNDDKVYDLIELALLNGNSSLFDNSQVNTLRFLYLYFVNKQRFGEAFYILKDLMNTNDYLPIDWYFNLHLSIKIGFSKPALKCTLKELRLKENVNLDLLQSDIARVQSAIDNESMLDPFLLKIDGLSQFSDIASIVTDINISDKEKKVLTAIIQGEDYNLPLVELQGRLVGFTEPINKKMDIPESVKDKDKYLFRDFERSVKFNLDEIDDFITAKKIKVNLEDDIRHIKQCIKDKETYKYVLSIINRLRFEYDKNDTNEKYIAVLLGAAYFVYTIDIMGSKNLLNIELLTLIQELIELGLEEVIASGLSGIFPLVASQSFLYSLVAFILVKSTKEIIQFSDKDWTKTLIDSIDDF